MWLHTDLMALLGHALLGWLIVGGALAARQCVREFRAKSWIWGIILAVYALLSLLVEIALHWLILMVGAAEGIAPGGLADLMAANAIGVMMMAGVFGIRRHQQRDEDEEPLETRWKLGLSVAAIIYAVAYCLLLR